MKTTTIVIGSAGYGHLVGHAIESVLSQIVLPDEIIVVDDGYHDRTCEVAKKYGIRCIEREKNWGTIKNYNDILFNQVKTERVMFLGADDWLRADALEKLNKENADIVSYDYAITGYGIGKRGKRYEHKDGYYIRRFRRNMPDIKREIKRHNFIHGSALYNVELARKVGGYEVIRKGAKTLQEDWMLWKRMIIDGNATHIHIPEPFLYYRKHKFNVNN